MDWINNQWVIGIGTSIVSGLLVFFFTRKFFTEKQKREYNQKIRTANNEILYAIRPLIVERTKPSIEILDSVFISTARKYSVELEDIYSKERLCDDLTNEIMSNSFLSSDQKLELASMINTLKSEVKKESDVKIITIHRDGKSNTSTSIAMIISLMTGMFALVFTIYSTIKEKVVTDSILEDSNKFPEYLSVLLLAMTIPLIAVTMTTFLKFVKEKEKNRERDKWVPEKDTKNKM